VPEPFSFEPRGERLELVSRGDLVPVRLWSGERGASARPLVVIVADLAAGKDAREVAELAAALAAEGWLAAALDLPLQGERVSAKLSARLVACGGREPRSETDRLLWGEFLRQATLDLGAALALVRRRESVDAERVACVAYAAGAAAAEAWAAQQPRVRVLRAERGAAPAQLVLQLRRLLARS
jgi:dienelactone hydrolase